MLFTQLVIPNLHNHTEKHHAEGIHVLADDDTCMICALDIVPADFILPILFSFSVLLLFYTSRVRVWNIETVIFSIFKKGRAPPLVFA